MEQGAPIPLDPLDNIKRLLKEDPDWIFSRRYGFSAEKLAKKYPDGVPMKILVEVLMTSEEVLQVIWDDLIEDLQRMLKPKEANE